MVRKPRGLRPDERELWDLVARRTQPLRPPATGPRTAPAPVDAHKVAAPLAPFDIGASAERQPDTAVIPTAGRNRLAAQPVRMDRKTFMRMSRGKLVPEARIDLHGMTLAEAHPALVGFILSSHVAGRRLVLVITGKGRATDGDIFRRRGILRHQVPDWLKMPPLTGIVLDIREAHVRHGGAGALYVYLRRAR